MTEPNIVINGKQLTDAQAMAVRVAVSNFFMELKNPDALGEDEEGRAMTKDYYARLTEIINIIRQE